MITNPSKVPLPDDPRWRVAATQPCSPRQVNELRGLLMEQATNVEDVFGFDVMDLPQLSRWAAHWGIEQLLALRTARAVEEANRAVAEDTEADLKSWIAAFFAAQHPSLRSTGDSA